MKIAHIVSTFLPHPGGMGQVCFEEAKLLAKEHQVTVFTLAYKGKLYREESWPFKVRRLEPLIQLGDAGWLIDLKKELAGFDLVHLHYPFYGACGSLIKAKKLLGFPLVVTYHMDAQSTGIKKLIGRVYDFFYTGDLLKVADKIVAVDADYFRNSKYGRFIGKEKSAVLPNAVNTEFFLPGPADFGMKPLSEFTGKNIVLFVGNLLPVKNLALLINILPKLADDVCLLVAGGGYEEERYKQLVSDKELDGRVRFVSNFSQDDLLNFYRAAALVAVPSFSESFSLVALSAMSAGAIVAVSDIPGLRARIKDADDGFLIPVDNAEAWISGLKMIINLSPEKRRAISEQARKNAQNFSLEKHGAELNEIYSSVTSF